MTYQRDDKMLVAEFLQHHTGIDCRKALESASFEDWARYRAAHYDTAVVWKRSENFPDDPRAKAEYMDARLMWSKGLLAA